MTEASKFSFARVVWSSGDLSLSTMVGGTALALRHARTAARAGFAGLCFAIDDEQERLHVRRLLDKASGPDDFLIEFETSEPCENHTHRIVLRGPALYLRTTLSPLAKTTEKNAPKVAPEVAPDFSLSAASNTKAAEEFLFSQIRKSVQLDGVLAYYVMRPLARVFTRALLNTKISPNQATLSALACGIAAAICAGIGGACLVAIAGALYWFGGVLDCIDGELARMRMQSSKVGEWLDSMVDEFSTVSLMAGIGIGLSRDGYGAHWVYLGLGAAALAIMSLAPMYTSLHRRKLPIDTAHFPWFFGTPTSGQTPTGAVGKIANTLGYLIRRDANLTATALLLLLNLREACLLLMFAAFALTTLLLLTHYLVMASRRRSQESRP